MHWCAALLESMDGVQGTLLHISVAKKQHLTMSVGKSLL